MADFHRQTRKEVVTRKDHACELCGEIIAKGLPALSHESSGLFELEHGDKPSRFFKYRWHTHFDCQDKWDAHIEAQREHEHSDDYRFGGF